MIDTKCPRKSNGCLVHSWPRGPQTIWSTGTVLTGWTWWLRRAMAPTRHVSKTARADPRNAGYCSWGDDWAQPGRMQTVSTDQSRGCFPRN